MRPAVARAVALAALLSGCVAQETRTLQSLDQPIQCATAEGDIRVLESEKAYGTSQVLQGLWALSPTSMIVGQVTGSEGTRVQVGTGDYNTKIAERIAQIKARCGLE
jgi:hypothetical protein